MDVILIWPTRVASRTSVSNGDDANHPLLAGLNNLNALHGTVVLLHPYTTTMTTMSVRDTIYTIEKILATQYREINGVSMKRDGACMAKRICRFDEVHLWGSVCVCVCV